VLRSFSLDSGAEIRLGTTQWLTPEGNEVRGIGIAPDTEVVLSNLSDMLMPSAAAKLTMTELLQGKDTQLSAALTQLGAK